jgi:hypothetical protein
MRILALVVALLLISAPSAVAGGWAVTYVDPVPSFDVKTTYTVGYQVLQHGTHPFEGDLGKTGLKFRSGNEEHVFVGVPMGEPARYAALVRLPAGQYEVFGVQGLFRDHPIGTLTVPGTLLIKPVDPQLVQRLEPQPAPAPAAAVVPEEPADEPLPVWAVGLVVVGAAGAFLLLRKRLRPAARG